MDIEMPAPQIQIIRVNLDELDVAEQLSQRRRVDEYNPLSINEHKYLLPANISRPLLSKESFLSLQETAARYEIEDIHLRVVKYGLPWSTGEGVLTCYVPFHVATAFRYKGFTITGRVFVSLLHATIGVLPACFHGTAWAEEMGEVKSALLPLERQSLIEYYWRAYLYSVTSSTDYTTIAIRSKSEETRVQSPTHLAFASFALNYPEGQGKVETDGKYDVYLFSHCDELIAIEQARCLFLEPQLRVRLVALKDAWQANAASKEYNAAVDAESKIRGYSLLEAWQLYTSLNWIRVAWRKAVGREENLPSRLHIE